MLRIRPFRAIRPVARHAVHVASVPYDVVSTAEARDLAAGDPASFLHVVRPEIDLPDGTPPYDDAVYEMARRNLGRLLEEGYLIRDDEPRMYLYRLVMEHVCQVGLVCCCHIDDYRDNVIKKHEKTRRDKEDDRTRHMLTLNANVGPVFLTYRDRAEVDRLVESDMNDRPLYHFNASDGVTHTVWIAKDPAAYVAAMGGLDAAYVADGHHRSASAARAGSELRSANPDHRGDEEYNWFLTVMFPASQLRILSYNRVVRDLHGLSAAAFLERLATVGTVTPTDEPTPERAGVFCVYVGGGWHRCDIDPSLIDRADPVRSLDVALLEEHVLGPILGIGDIRTDERIGFVGGIRGTADLARRVDSGEAAVAFSLYPTSIEQLLAVSDDDCIMPPKSTWFEPKLRSGVFVHELS